MIPLKLDQVNNRICEFESGVDQIDPQFVPTDPDVAAAQAAANAAQADATQAIADAAAAQAAADLANTEAIQAQADAAAAQTDATQALADAAQASTDAGAALASAVAAQALANVAQADATQAILDAATAQTAANAAQATADQAILDAAAALAEAQTRLQSVVAGEGIDVDNTDPLNPIVSRIFPPYLYEEAIGPFTHTADIDGDVNVTADIFPDPPVLTLVTGVLEAGTYQFEWTYLWTLDSVTQDFVARIEQRTNGVGVRTVFGVHRQEPQDSAGGVGDGGFAGAGTNQRQVVSSFREVVMNGTDSLTFDFRHAPNVTGTEATVGDVRMKIMRVA